MRLANFNKPLGAESAPFGFNALHEEETGSWWSDNGGAVIGAGANILAGILSSQSIKSTAEYDAARNEALAKEQMAFQKAMWDESNRYNDPKNEYARLKAAGLNPILSQASIGKSVATPMNGVTPPYQKTTPFAEPIGLGVSNAVQTYLGMQQNKREDYRLASDITFKDFKTRQDHLRYLLDKSTSEKQSEWINKQMEKLNHDMAMESDKFSHMIEWDNFQKEVQEEQLRINEAQVGIQAMLANSKIDVDAATVMNFAELSNESRHRVYEMQANGASQRSINHYIEQQEKSAASIIANDEKQKNYNNKGFKGQYTRFVNWMLSPLKGILSGGASVSKKVP